MEVVRNWFNLMQDDGWIPREQILGEEARSKVPEQFQVQHDTHANPPTLLFTIEYLSEIVMNHDKEDEHIESPKEGEQIEMGK